MTDERLHRLGDDLYAFDDSCRVYIVRSGREAVLVDLGNAEVLDALGPLGIDRVRDVLFTHHHRDGVQGAPRAAAHGARLWVPHAEQDLFRSVDAHWQAREIANSYNNRQDRFSLLEPVPVAGTLEDYATYRFGDVEFTVLPTPGHTPGSIGLQTHLDGRRVVFSGDLIAAPGKIWSLAATQWSYNGAEGVAAGIASLLDLRERRPDLLLPSHGNPIEKPAEAIDLLVERLWALLRARGDNPNLLRWRADPYVALTPHLLWNRTSTAYGYVLLSESGKALLIDYGYDFMTGMAAGFDRAARRPSLYTLPALQRGHGVTAIDVVMPTHYHDDHVAGLNLLRATCGTRVWAAENFADILERPARYDLPCLWYDPIRVDRALPLERPVRWEEYTLTLHPQPGHTRHAVAIGFEVDGRRVLAIGDQYQGGAEAGWNYVYNNGFHIDDYRKSAALYRAYRPDLILSGHWEPYRASAEYLDRLQVRGDELARLHRDLLPAESFEAGGPEFSARLEPYRSEVRPGGVVDLRATVRNPLARRETLSVALVVPPGWRAHPAVASLRLEPHAEGEALFSVTPAAAQVRRARVATEIRIGGRSLGQRAEALVTVAPPRGGA